MSIMDASTLKFDKSLLVAIGGGAVGGGAVGVVDVGVVDVGVVDVGVVDVGVVVVGVVDVGVVDVGVVDVGVVVGTILVKHKQSSENSSQTLYNRWCCLEKDTLKNSGVTCCTSQEEL